jgi:hypothetical protein
MSARKIEDLAQAASNARDAVSDRLNEVRTRTSPAALADDAIDYASTQGRALAEKARSVATAHPLAIGAGIAAIGLALLARQKLKSARIDFGDDATDYTDYDDSFAASPEAEEESEAAPAQSPMLSVLLGLAAGAVLGALTPDKS